MAIIPTILERNGTLKVTARTIAVALVTAVVLSVSGHAWAQNVPTPVVSEATDDIGSQEFEVAPQPSARVQPPWCLQQIYVGKENYDARTFNLFAAIDTLYVDKWATFRLILRGKQKLNSAPVTVFKWDHELGPNESNDLVAFMPDINVPYVVGQDGKVYRWVRPVVKLVQPGKNPVLSDMVWNKVSTMFWTPTCTRQYIRAS